MSSTSSSPVSSSSSSSLAGSSSSLFAITSSTSPPQRPDGPAPSGGNGNGGNQNNFGAGPELTSSASLYLYTFLATIVLLLLVSITIVARSYALRRRQQAIIAEAIANGTYIPPKKPGIGEKPKMYEVYIGDEEVGREEVREGEKEKAKQREQVGSGFVVDWDRIMPIACRWLDPPDALRQLPTQATSDLTASPTPALRRRFPFPGLLSRLRLPHRGHRQPTSPAPTPTESATDPTTNPPDRDPRASILSTEKPPLTPEPPEEKVRVAVLISMPFSDPLRKRKSMASAVSEPELPHMEFGTAEVSAGSLASILEVSAADSTATRTSVERRTEPPAAVGSDTNV